MTVSDATENSVCLLGRDHGEYGNLRVVEVGSRSAAGISVGSDADSPSNRFKANANVPNEDALCVVESHLGISAYAVADAHYGPEASHTLIRRLYDGLQRVMPRTTHELSHLLDTLQDGPPPGTESETTLLVAIYDQELGSGFGISFGDSSFVVSGVEAIPNLANQRNGRYVSTSPDQPPLEGATFTFSTRPGDMLLAYSDGVDECHYRSPTTSVSPGHIAQIVVNNPQSPRAVVAELGQLALNGVNGNPGGQDNISLIASLA